MPRPQESISAIVRDTIKHVECCWRVAGAINTVGCWVAVAVDTDLLKDTANFLRLLNNIVSEVYDLKHI